MSQADTFGVYVRARLEAWGVEFALHRDCEYLGHQSRNQLAVIAEYGGRAPRATGFKPLETNVEAQQIEDIVCDIAGYNLTRAVVLRAYYCGMGRRGVERFEIANELLIGHGLPGISRAKYFAEHELGCAEARGVLAGLARAA